MYVHGYLIQYSKDVEYNLAKFRQGTFSMCLHSIKGILIIKRYPRGVSNPIQMRIWSFPHSITSNPLNLGILPQIQNQVAYLSNPTLDSNNVSNAIFRILCRAHTCETSSSPCFFLSCCYLARITWARRDLYLYFLVSAISSDLADPPH